MVPASLPRLALVASLVVLGVSLAGFATVAGLADDLSTATAGEVTVEDGAVAFVDADGHRTPIADVGDAEQLAVADKGGLLAVTTQPNETEALTESQRETAARVAVSNPALAEMLRTADGVTVDVVPLRTDDPVDSQLRRPNPSADSAASTTPEFRPAAVADSSITLERVGPQFHEHRALVIVEPVDADAEYRVVVDLDAEVVDRIFQLEVLS
ncbi:hypothetical protein [Natrialba swarupiae]|uniref:Uncharacterized protein n=1 Tax=Natrialba swarupiae TaxID=2448032 RepID=A0A5D5AL75_9EURY|nr:hypothetical protein [Natrialba swarupiae]TYT61695.1 hypothetical protein FYC77_12575 [Natrialba swarupiae]